MAYITTTPVAKPPRLVPESPVAPCSPTLRRRKAPTSTSTCRIAPTPMPRNSAVEPLVDVPFQRHRMAVIEVAAEGLGVELVGPRLARRDLAGAGNAVHAGRVDAVEVHRVRVAAGVAEANADAVALGRADRRTRHPAIVGPGREEQVRGNLDLLVDRRDLVAAQPPAVRQFGHRAAIEVRQDVMRIETVAGVVHLTDGRHAVGDGAGAGLRGPGRRPATDDQRTQRRSQAGFQERASVQPEPVHPRPIKQRIQCLLNIEGLTKLCQDGRHRRTTPRRGMPPRASDLVAVWSVYGGDSFGGRWGTPLSARAELY